MRRVVRVSVILMLGLASPARGATVLQGAGDTIATCFFGASVRIEPGTPDIAWLGCPSIAAGAYPFAIDPNVSLAAGGTPFFVPALGAGVFLDDVWLERSDLAWLTTSGVEAVVPFDPSTGAAIPLVVDGVPTDHISTSRSFVGSFQRSDGTSIAGFPTDFTSGVTRVGDRLVVATSNFHSEGLNAVNDPGTVLVFALGESTPGQLDVSYVGHAITSDFNPTEVTALPNGLVAITNTGVIRLTTPPTATSPGSIDVFDPQTLSIRASMPFGVGGPAYRKLAVDATGSLGLVGSAVFSELYALDLRGLDQLPDPGVDETTQRTSCNVGPGGGVPCASERVLRGPSNPIPIPAGAPQHSGFIPEVAFGASDDFAVATSSDDRLLVLLPIDPRNLDGPHPLHDSRLGAVETFSAFQSGSSDHSPGPMALRPSASGTLAGTAVIYASSVALNRALLGGSLTPPTGDLDLDGFEDALDVCPQEPDPGQSDRGQVGGPGPDGIGDLCQCADQSGDGIVNASDVAGIEQCVAGAAACVPLCDGTGDQACDAADVTAAQLALAGLGRLRCAAFSLP